jgi:hypothetical protein
MRARFINELNFQRGQDPKQVMGIGAVAKLEAEAIAKAKDSYSWDRDTDKERLERIIDEKKNLLGDKIRAQDFEAVRTILEQPDKIYKSRIKGAIVELVWSAADRKQTLAECHKRQEAAIEFMPYLISKGANPKFRNWSAFKDSCDYSLSKFMELFINDFGCDPHMGGEMPMRRISEENIKYYADKPEMLKRIWESMQTLLDAFKK